MLAYISISRDTPDYFFIDRHAMQEVLKEVGYLDDQYAGHSFCIEAATAAAAAGLEDSLIQTLGRWQSTTSSGDGRVPLSPS